MIMQCLLFLSEINIFYCLLFIRKPFLIYDIATAPLWNFVDDQQGGGDGAEGQDEEQHEGGPDAGVPQTTLHSQVGAQPGTTLHCAQ